MDHLAPAGPDGRHHAPQQNNTLFTSTELAVKFQTGLFRLNKSFVKLIYVKKRRSVDSTKSLSAGFQSTVGHDRPPPLHHRGETPDWSFFISAVVWSCFRGHFELLSGFSDAFQPFLVLLHRFESLYGYFMSLFVLILSLL